MDQHVQTHSAPTRRASDLPPENRATDGASPAPALTRLGAVLRAARGSRPLTSLSGDQLAMGLSGLCLVHCLASTIFFASIASVSGVLENHLFQEIGLRSEEHTSELQSLMRISYAVCGLNKKKTITKEYT